MENLCEHVAVSLVPSVAAAASSGTSVRCSRRNFGTCIIAVVLPLPGLCVRSDRSCAS